MGWEKLADLGAGIFKRWFSKEARQESRANEIERLQKEQKRLALLNVKGRYDRQLERIAVRLGRLYREAKNTR